MRGRVTISILFAALAFAAHGATNQFVVDLPEVLRLADARNLDVQIARQVLAEARANHRAALEQFFPWISPGVQFRRRDGLAQAVPSGVISEAKFESYAPGASIAGQVSIGEAIYNSLAARQSFRASSGALEAQRLESATLAAHRYFDVVRMTALVEVNREAVRISRSYEEQLRAAVAAGIAFRGDELRVRTQTERYQIALRQSEERTRIASAQLAQSLHLDPSVELASADSGLTVLNLVATNSSLDSLVQEALLSRPEIAQGTAVVAASNEARKAVTFGPLVPALGVQYYGGGFGGGPDHFPDRFGTTEELTATLGWRIGPGGLLDRARIDASKARLEANSLRLQKLKDEVIRQVVESHTALQSLADQIPAAEQNLATASESARLAQCRKEFGVGVVLEDLQAQQEIVRARADYVTTIAEFNKAQFSLRRAIGGQAPK